MTDPFQLQLESSLLIPNISDTHHGLLVKLGELEEPVPLVVDDGDTGSILDVLIEVGELDHDVAGHDESGSSHL